MRLYCGRFLFNLIHFAAVLLVGTGLNAKTAYAQTTPTPTLHVIDIKLIEPATEIPWETLAKDSASTTNDVRVLPVRAEFHWLDDSERTLLQVSYTLRGPASFAQQVIRTEPPFTDASFALQDLPQGSYRLEIRALDQLGVEVGLNEVVLEFQGPTATSNAQSANKTATPSTQSANEAITSNTTASNTVASSTNALDTASADTVVSDTVTSDTAPSATALSEENKRSNSQIDDKTVVATLAPTANTAQVEPAASDNIFQLPGLPVAIPRSLRLWLLPVLLLIIGYLIYSVSREQREHQSPTTQSDTRFVAEDEDSAHYTLQNKHAQNQAGGHYHLDPYHLDDVQENATQRFSLHGEQTNTDKSLGAATSPPVSAHSGTSSESNQRNFVPVRAQVGISKWGDEADIEDELTRRPFNIEDEEATFRPETVMPPMIGQLVRATGEPNLPQEIPIYDLSGTSGEFRQIYIGRHSQNNTFVLNDKRVSREHAVIIQRDGQLYLRDNGSTAGTFLNGKRLSPGEELLLRHNDLIGFGQIAYEVQLDLDDERTIIG